MNNIAGIKETMSSLEIAKLTGKEHAKVTIDIEKMLGSLEIDDAGFRVTSKDSMNRDRKTYNLPKRECLILVSGYNVKMRASIIDRWQELEATQHKVPTTFLEAMELATEQARRLIEKDRLLIATNEASIKAGEILVRELVKSVDVIDLGEKQFYAWMRDQKLLLKNSNQPYQKYVTMGIFTWKPSEEKHGGKFRYTLMVTARGKVWLSSRYMKFIDNNH